MIDLIEGEVVANYGDSLSVKCFGLAFRVFVPLRIALKKPQKVKLFTKLIIPKEGTPHLYGFETEKEREIFECLVKIPGVGSRTALNILSQFEPKKLEEVINSGSVSELAKVKGIGPKLARRIIAEMKGKFLEVKTKNSELFEILKSLGYTTSEIEKALSQVDISNLSVEKALKEVLKVLHS